MSDNSNVVYFGSSPVPGSIYKTKPADTPFSTVDDSVTIHNEDTYREITQAMYKQNLELAVRNKTLSVLRTLYAITMSSLEVQEVAQRIADTVVKELNFTAALIDLVDHEQNLLRPVAITRSPDILKVMELIGKPLGEITISMTDTSNLTVNSISKKERSITSNLLDILVPRITQEIADEIERKVKIKTLVIYPLILGNKAVGALTVGLGKRVDDLSRAEKETMEQLIDVVTIALDRARLHEDLHKANIQLQELDRLKDEFVSLASHELRTPMTAIKGSLSTILEGYVGEVSPQAKEFLNAAYSENDRLIRLINNLLNISRIEAGRFTFTVTKVDLDKLITEVVRNLQPAATERHIYLKYEKVGSLFTVFADEDKVKEVVINLVGNATKFTHKGGITVKTVVKDNMIITSVTDTGSGIAKEDQELLFKKFSQVGRDYARPMGGTGLGLYISKQIVEGLKGRIWLESTLEKGTTFYFSLPIVS